MSDSVTTAGRRRPARDRATPFARRRTCRRGLRASGLTHRVRHTGRSRDGLASIATAGSESPPISISYSSSSIGGRVLLAYRRASMSPASWMRVSSEKSGIPSRRRRLLVVCGCSLGVPCDVCLVCPRTIAAVRRGSLADARGRRREVVLCKGDSDAARGRDADVNTWSSSPSSSGNVVGGRVGARVAVCGQRPYQTRLRGSSAERRPRHGCSRRASRRGRGLTAGADEGEVGLGRVLGELREGAGARARHSPLDRHLDLLVEVIFSRVVESSIQVQLRFEIGPAPNNAASSSDRRTVADRSSRIRILGRARTGGGVGVGHSLLARAASRCQMPPRAGLEHRVPRVELELQVVVAEERLADLLPPPLPGSRPPLAVPVRCQASRAT